MVDELYSWHWLAIGPYERHVDDDAARGLAFAAMCSRWDEVWRSMHQDWAIGMSGGGI